MAWWLIVLIVALVVLVLVAVGGFILYRHASVRTRAMASRIQHLPTHAKVRLLRELLLDRRIPASRRLILLCVALYLLLPVDIIPDFLPVIGQLDDVIVLLVGLGLLRRSVSYQVLDEHVTRLESAT